ncbi:MAG: hypothetical protein J7K11_04300 [Candidatus Hydrothermae bacterium]|nr:hypothetical protein [Candidatus Hydrothermae bacterium]
MWSLVLIILMGAEGSGLALGEKTYDFYVSGQKKGEIKYVIDTLREGDTLLYRFTSLTLLEGDTVDSTVVNFRNDFTPVSSAKYLNTPQTGKMTLKVTYKPDKAIINLETASGSKEMDVKYKDRVYDNEEITLILPFLDFGDKDQIEIRDLSSFSGTVVKIKVTRKGQEEIDLNGEKVKAERYDLKFLGKKVSVYYAPENRRMVYYLDRTQKIEMKSQKSGEEVR